MSDALSLASLFASSFLSATLLPGNSEVVLVAMLLSGVSQPWLLVLNVFPICLPPLRERPEDIPLLVKAFTAKIARRMGRNIDSIPAETLRTLSSMEWPGNVRELENVIERAVLLTRGNVLQLSLPEVSLPETTVTAAEIAKEGEDEYQLIMRVLKETNGVVAGPKGAAQRLGLKRTTLLSRMKRLGIDKENLL